MTSASINSASPDRAIWDGMLAHLRAHHPTICRAWFEELEPLGIAGGAIQLRTHSPIHRDYLKRQCSDIFNDAARTVSGHLLSVRFLGPDDKPDIALAARPRENAVAGLASPATVPTRLKAAPLTNGHAAGGPSAEPNGNAGAEASRGVTGVGAGVGFGIGVGSGLGAGAGTAPAADRGATSGLVSGTAMGVMTQSVSPPRVHAPVVVEAPARSYADASSDSLPINPDNSFENFVVGPGNRIAHAAALAVAQAQLSRPYNPLFIHGGVGLGKTHLLHAICLKLVEERKIDPSRMYYTSCDSLLNQVIAGMSSGEMGAFGQRFQDLEVLVVDDIHFLTKRDLAQEMFFNTFNSIHQANKQIILSSDAPPDEIPHLQERLVSRFNWGLVAKVEAPGYETRIAILKTKARLRGVPMPDEVAAYVASRIDSNIRELEGAVVKLQIQSAVDKVPINLELAKAALGDIAPPVVGEPTIQGIIAAVTDFFSVRLTDLQGKDRHRSVALPRQVCMFLARRCTRHSLEEIGGFFGGRDHTTVMHAIKTVEAKRNAEEDFAVIVRSLEERVRAPKA